MNFFGRLKDVVFSAGNKLKQEINDLVQENSQLQVEELKQEKSKIYPPLKIFIYV